MMVGVVGVDNVDYLRQLALKLLHAAVYYGIGGVYSGYALVKTSSA